MPDLGKYQASFEMMIRDFQKVAEFVEPSAANSLTFSFRIYELTLRVCTEFESFCKELLVASGYGKPPEKMNITDYTTLESTLFLENILIALTVWNPKEDFIQPFKNWSKERPPLNWYKQYNDVKHNRNSLFSKASMENLRYSMCGLFCCLVKAGAHFSGNELWARVDEHTVETKYSPMPFCVRRTDAQALASVPAGRGIVKMG